MPNALIEMLTLSFDIILFYETYTIYENIGLFIATRRQSR